MPYPLATPEPVPPDAPAGTRKPLLTQAWLGLAFLHRAMDPSEVAGLLPAGTVPDTFDGATYVGLMALRMHRAGWPRLPGIPYFGTFPEADVRLYTVDAHGRRGVAFRSLEASRLVPAIMGRALFRLPYVWSKTAVRAEGDTLAYTSSRRWPGPRGARCRRWGEEYDGRFVRVFEISGSIPSSHLAGGYAEAVSLRQNPVYFPAGGGTLSGVSRPGEIVWSRLYIADGTLHLDIGRGRAVEPPQEETRRRRQATDPEWPITHAVPDGVSRDQFMARHKANHIQVVYAPDAAAADRAPAAKATAFERLGVAVHLCGDVTVEAR